MTERTRRIDVYAIRRAGRVAGLLLWLALTASLLYTGFTEGDLENLILGVALVVMQHHHVLVRRYCGGDTTDE